MNIQKTNLDGVLLITPPVVHEDFRGTNTEIYNKECYRDLSAYGHNPDFVLESVSTSRQHVLRGIHGDAHTTKLISCLYGSFYFVVVNNDPFHPQYRQWQSFTLSDKNRQQILVPPKYGNGHLVMSDYVVFHYKLDAYYDRASQFTIRWNDPNFNIWWPISRPILSERDDTA
jgi:dTDP-4-dehydrorhamnose 3,5-epimerase